VREGLGRARSWLGRRLFPDPPVPTLVHVTHAKAGSTWMHDILRTLFPMRVTRRGHHVAEAEGGDLARHVFAPGWIYPAMFMTRGEFLAHPELRDVHRFVVIRDLRDTLVSLYFSLRHSHTQSTPELVRDRALLTALGREEGLRALLPQLEDVAELQTSWLRANEVVLRYEDLLGNDVALLSEVLLDRFRLPVTRVRLARVIAQTRFERVFHRKLGHADPMSHGRQGLPGDWRKHFTPTLGREFEAQFGEVLRRTGYTTDDAWTREISVDPA